MCLSVFLCAVCWCGMGKTKTLAYEPLSSTCTNPANVYDLDRVKWNMCTCMRAACSLQSVVAVCSFACVRKPYIRMFIWFSYASGSCLYWYNTHKHCVSLSLRMFTYIKYKCWTLNVECWCWLEILQHQQHTYTQNTLCTL